MFVYVQIENEYGPESKALGAAGYAYMTWAAKMAFEMNTGVPWVMCKEDDAPDPVVSILVGHKRFVMFIIHLKVLFYL